MVSGYFCRRNRVDVVVRVHTHSVRLSALEAPQILAAGVEVEAHEVAAASSFEIELATPFVEYSVEINRFSHVLSVGTFLQFLYILQCILFIAKSIESLCTSKINLAKAEQRNIRITEVVAVNGTTVRAYVRPFHDRESVEEVLNLLVWSQTAHATGKTAIEKCAVVASLVDYLLCVATKLFEASRSLSFRYFS